MRLLREVACSRSGDKGDIVNIAVMPYERADWELLRERLTVEVVADRIRGLTAPSTRIRRYELPGIPALNFVIDGALAGGVASSLRVDGHGKSFQSLILEAEL
jgi:hypothetical protein